MSSANDRRESTVLLRYGNVDEPPVRVALKAASAAAPRRAEIDDRAVEFDLRTLPEGAAGRMTLVVDGRTVCAHVAALGSQVWVHMDGVVWRFEQVAAEAAARSVRPSGGSAAGGGAPDGRLNAPMPGRVLDVLFRAGESVKAGETVVLLEAMKMELRLPAAIDGVVETLHVQAGALVERGAPLLVVRPAESGEGR